jgi:predicted ester cyclase
MLKKILIGFAIFFVLLIGALAAFPFLFKDKIIAAVKTEINKNVNAKVDFGDFSLSIFRDFPNLSFAINDVSVINLKPFEGDTLAYIGNFNISLDIMTVINAETYDVKSIDINNAKINAKKSKAGNTNWDIAKDTGKEAEAGESSPFSLKLRKFSIADSDIVFDDDSSKTYAKITNLNIDANGDFTQDIFVLNSNTTIEKLTYRDGATSYLKDAELALKADVEINQTTNKYTFKENELKLNGLTLGLDGFVVMNETDYDLDVKLNTKQTDFKTLLSLIPNIYKKDFESVKASGKLALNAFAKGKYSETFYPAFGLNLDVDNGTFQYPSVPTAVKNIFIDLKVSNPGGDLDKTLVDLSRFNMTVDNDPFSLKAKVSSPISDPNIDAQVKGKIDLKKVPAYYPMEDLKNLTGVLTADVTAKGRLSAIEQERYQDFDARGTLDLKGFRYESADLPAPLSIANMSMTFNPKNVTLNDLNARIGKSDFAAKGTLDNLLNYVFADDKLKGSLSLRSNNLDLNEFMAESTTETATTTSSDTVLDVKVPDNIDFVINGTFNSIQYDKIALKNVSGVLTVQDETVRISNLVANVFNGSILANGTYSTKNVGNPEISFNYDLKNIDFQEWIFHFSNWIFKNTTNHIIGISFRHLGFRP